MPRLVVATVVMWLSHHPITDLLFLQRLSNESAQQVNHMITTCQFPKPDAVELGFLETILILRQSKEFFYLFVCFFLLSFFLFFFFLPFSLTFPPFSRSPPHRESLCGVMAKMLNCSLKISEFKLQCHYCVHFWANTLGKGVSPFIPPERSSAKMPLALNNPRRLICN